MPLQCGKYLFKKPMRTKKQKTHIFLKHKLWPTKIMIMSTFGDDVVYKCVCGNEIQAAVVHRKSSFQLLYLRI